MNPYKTTRMVLRGIGYTLMTLLAVFLAVAFTTALWAQFGAWALTWPVVFPLVSALVGLFCVLVSELFEGLAKWWRRREREWAAR